MTDVTLNSLHDDIVGLRIDIVRLESKIDSKPSLMAMFTGIVVVMAGVVASTIATLHVLGMIK